ncbi:MAG: hypothetical protein MZV64_49210 [Ignavibacteriales bacterium]|nr:hypothetical protein [Ignavibacteriales bacterium]
MKDIAELLIEAVEPPAGARRSRMQHPDYREISIAVPPEEVTGPDSEPLSYVAENVGSLGHLEPLGPRLMQSFLHGPGRLFLSRAYGVGCPRRTHRSASRSIESDSGETIGSGSRCCASTGTGPLVTAQASCRVCCTG